jgi:hypothetical protein
MKYVATIFLLGTICAAEEQKPACNASNHGRFWPQQANTSAETAQKLSRRGELEMCSLVVWKYRWQKLTVNARDLARKKTSISGK